MRVFTGIILSLCSLISAGSLDINTLIYTSSGLQKLKNVQKHHHLISGIASHSHLVTIQAKRIVEVQSYVILYAGNTQIKASCDQRLYGPIKDNWIEAAAIKPGQLIQTIAGTPLAINRVEKIKAPCRMMQVSVSSPHIFAIGHEGILAHNEAIAVFIGGSSFYLAPTIAQMTPLAIIATKALSASLISYCSWIIAGDVLKNIGGFSGALEWIKETCTTIKAKITNFKVNPERAITLLEPADQTNSLAGKFLSHSLDFPLEPSPIHATHDDEINSPNNSPIIVNPGAAPSPFNDPDDDPDQEKKYKVKFFEKNEYHIFRKDEGHLADTSENRTLLLETASDQKKFLGTDIRGNDWFATILLDRKQIWVVVREEMIRNGGINDIPREFNAETGLCQLKRVYNGKKINNHASL